MARLTLDTTGIKSPLDIESSRDAGEPLVEKAAPRAPRQRKPTMGDSDRETARGSLTQPAPSPPRRFRAGGRSVQTSIALDVALADQLEQFASTAAVSFNALVVALLHAGLPAETREARQLAVHERADQLGAQRIERNVRIPRQLRTCLDELLSGVRDAAPRATRADLVNAALRRTVPSTAEEAARAVADHQRQLELQALAA